MKAPLLFLVFIFCFMTAARAQKTTMPTDSAVINKTIVERDGSSYDKAIVILEKTEGKGEQAEYSWIRDKYPGSKPHNQSLNFHDKKSYDIIHITTADGKEVAVYFDISNFFGKY
jgi:hypothetical protein